MDTNINVYDIIETKDDLGYQLFLDEIEKIKHQSFKLKDNYINIDLSEFLCFTVVTYKNELLGFSGLQYRQNIYPDRIARAYSRLYFSENFRRKNLSVFRDRLKNYETPELAFPGYMIMLPYQIEKAKEMKLHGLFISRENVREKNIKSEQMRLNTFSELHNQKYVFKPLDKIYNVCGTLSIDKSCWQWIWCMMLDNTDTNIFDETFDSLTIQEWNATYGT